MLSEEVDTPFDLSMVASSASQIGSEALDLWNDLVAQVRTEIQNHK